MSEVPHVVAASIEDLTEMLSGSDRGVLVLPHGSAFPLDAWGSIRSFLDRGGSLVVLGGAPFHQPVRFEDGRWKVLDRQPTYAHELLIGPAEAVAISEGVQTALPQPDWTLPLTGGTTVWEPTVRLATRPDQPQEHGSEGYRDALLRPLVQLVDADGVPRACPLFEIDHLLGDRAGARWIFAPTDAPLTPSLIRAVVERAMEGASEVRAQPVYASVMAG
ncbi:MAG: hypothetical protein WBX15_18795, partial [Thermoanaerobaculia bacterium]